MSITPVIPKSIKGGAKRQIILDTETTGLDPADHRIIEIGCIELENRCFTGSYFHRYLNPMRSVDQGAFAVHGIDNAFLQDKPLFQEIHEELFAYLEGAELIIHNAPFDIGFLDREFKLSKADFGHIVEHCKVVDTLDLARRLRKGRRNNLDALCKDYKVDNSQRDLHGALKDARLLGEVYLRMTGGQMHFDLAATHPKISPEMPNKFLKAKSTDKLVVLKANDEEQAMHTAYLQWLEREF
jgi:DNA polymerase III subunit epsilon